ncbi:MAG: hypothetical protein ACP5HG_06100 [Anaerolineae bacterium]
MENHGMTSVSTFLGDSVVYRNLNPMDDRLPTFAEIASDLGIDGTPIPRKSEPDYARVMAALLRHAAALSTGRASIRRLIYVGDTQMNDGTAFVNLCEAGGWPGWAFIGSEDQGPANVKLVTQKGRTLYLANRWSMLRDFEEHCKEIGFAIDEEAAVIVDLDKTALGARGRNDHVINRARVEAVRQTVEALLGNAYDAKGFEASYHLLNQTEFHPFTTDNQDYLAYLCLILGSDAFALPALVEDIRSGHLQSFSQFLEEVETRSSDLPERLHHLHQDIYRRVKAGDPTPFKGFRYNEYRETVKRMGHLPPDARVSTLLAHEIVITYEVCELALAWRERGTVLFGLSDKPDEASIPTETLAEQGYQAIHRTPTHIVGEGALALDEASAR